MRGRKRHAENNAHRLGTAQPQLRTSGKTSSDNFGQLHALNSQKSCTNTDCNLSRPGPVMANENLKNALQNAGLTPEEFAQVIRVDPKKRARWVAGTTVPYPGIVPRSAVHSASQSMSCGPTRSPRRQRHRRTGTRPIAGNEITGRPGPTPRRDRPPSSAAIIENSDGAIEILDNGTAIDLTTDPRRRRLTEQSKHGRHVRLLTWRTDTASRATRRP